MTVSRWFEALRPGPEFYRIHCRICAYSEELLVSAEFAELVRLSGGELACLPRPVPELPAACPCCGSRLLRERLAGEAGGRNESAGTPRSNHVSTSSPDHAETSRSDHAEPSPDHAETSRSDHAEPLSPGHAADAAIHGESPEREAGR